MTDNSCDGRHTMLHDLQPAGSTLAFISISASWLNILPQGLTILATALGCVWYGVMLYDRFHNNKDKH